MQTHVRRPVPLLIGMVHLDALPGAPSASKDSLPATIEHAVAEAKALATAGYQGIMVENFGDAPFFPGRVPRLTVAAMTRVLSAIASAVSVPLGVNVLRNDGQSALAIAAVTGAQFIRVNVLVGAMVTDQGLVVGKAHQLARERAAIAPDVAILADVMVKHAQPLGMAPDLTQLVHDTLDRAGADAIVVSGSGTGQPVDMDRLRAVKAAAGSAPVLIGSGATTANLSALRQNGADGIIVGTSIKLNGRVDVKQANAFAQAFQQLA